MIESRLQASGRITVPPEVRDALGLNACDWLPYELDGDRVIVTRAPAEIDEHGEDALGDGELAAVTAAALADGRPARSMDDMMAEVTAHIAVRQRRRDAV